MPRTLVMGIVNVTPDSFSDGGLYFDIDEAVRHSLELISQGADIIDIGGESTRPGADRVPEIDEKRRVVPVIKSLAKEGVPLSIDTTRSEVAVAAVLAGATIVNDVSGGLADKKMHKTVAALGCDYVLQHWRGHGVVMDSLTHYENVLATVKAELSTQIELALKAGINPERIIVDPGLGFAKNREHDWTLLAHLDEIKALGFRVLIGASRKRFLNQVAFHPDPVARDNATAVVTAWCAQHGIWAVRTHEVAHQVEAIKIIDTLTLAKWGNNV
jgi:dihydropteroate synthase